MQTKIKKSFEISSTLLHRTVVKHGARDDGLEAASQNRKIELKGPYISIWIIGMYSHQRFSLACLGPPVFENIDH